MSHDELYVYFKLPPAVATAALRSALRDWQRAQCQAWPGLEARLLERPADPAAAEALRTWMEVYRLPHGASPRHERAAALVRGAPALAAAGAPARHVEHFVESDPR